MTDWLRARWKWVVAGAAILLAFLVGLLLRKKPVVLPPVDQKQRQIEKETEEKELEAAEQRDERIQQIRNEHEAVIEKLTDEQHEKYGELLEDPDELNGWLKDVGKAQR